MKKILYIDFDFHIKTNSTHFLYELLEENFRIDKLFIRLDGSFDKIPNEYTSSVYDYLVLFQVMPEKNILELFSYKKGILFPMYDSCVYMTIDEWNRYKDFTIINFSKTLHNYLIKNGFETKYIQYFPKQQKIKSYGDSNSLFFWQRTDQIYINQILSLCENLEIKKVHIHKALDPGYHYIAVSQRFHYDFSYSDWFPQKSDLMEIIYNHAYYAAPRKYEGIGMAFLDAMAVGRCVIAPDFPTMNEYINNGVNGILFDYENPKAIEKYNVKELQKNAYYSIESGYKKWSENKYKIIDWIEKSKKKERISTCFDIKPKNNQSVNKVDKYHLYYLVMNHWMLLKNRKKSLICWFINKAVYHIAVYGYSEMASRLAEELEGSPISIDYYLDKEKKWTEDGKRTITIDQFVPNVDLVVVASFYYYDEIKELINKKFSIETVSLSDIIDDLLKKI